MRSSYIQNDYGKLLTNAVIALKPNPYFVELGVLDGYSTLHIAKGLKEIHRLYGIEAKLNAFDLFDDYEFKHGNQKEVQKLIDDNQLSQYVNLQKGDAYKVYDQFPDKRIEFLHVDISNTGDTIKNILEKWDIKMAPKGVILFEGGSEERDNIEWMKKYNMPSIKKELKTNQLVINNYMMATYFRFPSMTLLMRKWWD